VDVAVGAAVDHVLGAVHVPGVTGRIPAAAGAPIEPVRSAWLNALLRSSMTTVKPPGIVPVTLTATFASDVNASPGVRALVVRSLIGAVAFCACPSGSDV
jgi:hypothetical protein